MSARLFALLVCLMSSLPARVFAESFPFERQADDFCGEACFAMALRHWGVETNQFRIFGLTGLRPEEGRGGWSRDLYTAARAIWGAEFPSPWHEWNGQPADAEARFQRLVEWTAAGTPVMVCCRFSDASGAPEHFRLVTAVDAETAELTYQEPAEDGGAGRRMSKEQFLRLWPVAGGAHGLLIAFPLHRPPDTSRAALAAASEMPGQLAQAVRRVRARVPKHFQLGVEGPFVIASDQSPDGFKASRERTIRWAYEHLQRQFFPGGLNRPLEVYLFDGKASYDQYTRELFQDAPQTPFGYFSPVHHALIMNIATGGGTLVHEMVHPLMAQHFSGVPSWFNEGLASLFEQCGEQDGKMVGLLNWRHRGLLKAIESGAFQSLEKLMKTTTGQFYGNEQGDHYGIARYLCQYLQSKGKIEAYYRSFRQNREQDPAGIESLKAVLGEPSLARIQQDWLEWVKRLR